jgi:hypothetical protein
MTNVMFTTETRNGTSFSVRILEMLPGILKMLEINFNVQLCVNVQSIINTFIEDEVIKSAQCLNFQIGTSTRPFKGPTVVIMDMFTKPLPSNDL